MLLVGKVLSSELRCLLVYLELLCSSIDVGTSITSYTCVCADIDHATGSSGAGPSGCELCRHTWSRTLCAD